MLVGCCGPDVVGVNMSRRMRCGAPCIENSGQRQGLRVRRGSPDSGLSLLTGKAQEKFSSQRFQKSPDVGLCSEAAGSPNRLQTTPPPPHPVADRASLYMTMATRRHTAATHIPEFPAQGLCPFLEAVPLAADTVPRKDIEVPGFSPLRAFSKHIGEYSLQSSLHPFL